MSGVRCFVGIPLPADMRRDLVAASQAIRDAHPAWRGEKWVAEPNLHVTLVFVGSVAERNVQALTDALGAAATSARRFDLRLASVRAVPGTHNCRMVWADFDDPERGCATLASVLAQAAEPFGADKPAREFRAHVTLARARRSKPISADAIALGNSQLTLASQSMSVPSATLFSSTLSPSGPVYTELSTWDLLGR